MRTFFLHGLDSSSMGTKGRFFKENFPQVMVPDFEGSLERRLQKLASLCSSSDDLLLIGSSFGGLMATCFAIAHPQKVKRLIVMAPALNFPGFLIPSKKIKAPTFLLVGNLDNVTPADQVIPLAQKSFLDLEVKRVEEDHLLHNSFQKLDWHLLLQEK